MKPVLLADLTVIRLATCIRRHAIAALTPKDVCSMSENIEIQWSTPVRDDEDPSESIWFDEAAARRFAEKKGYRLLRREAKYSQWVEQEL